MTRVTLLNPSEEVKVNSAVDTLVETTQDFTDSAYTTHENRERIIDLCERVRTDSQRLVKVALASVSAVLAWRHYDNTCRVRFTTTRFMIGLE